MYPEGSRTAVDRRGRRVVLPHRGVCVDRRSDEDKTSIRGEQNLFEGGKKQKER